MTGGKIPEVICDTSIDQWPEEWFLVDNMDQSEGDFYTTSELWLGTDFEKKGWEKIREIVSVSN